MFSWSSQWALMSSVHVSSCALVGRLAEDDQVRRLEVVRALSQLLDGVSAVLEDALVAVDVGNRAATRGRVHERRVVGDEAEVLRARLDLLEIAGANRAVLDRQLVLFARAVIGNGERIGHRSGFRCVRRFAVSCDRHGPGPDPRRRATVPVSPGT
jgi:hypothetical protein